jgi:hypothetical protein
MMTEELEQRLENLCARNSRPGRRAHWNGAHHSTAALDAGDAYFTRQYAGETAVAALLGYRPARQLDQTGLR